MRRHRVALPATGSGRRDQRHRVTGQRLADHRTQHAVREASPTRMPPSRVCGVVGDHELGVGLVHRVVDHDLEAVRRDALRITETRDVDAEQLELGGHVGARGTRLSPPSSRSATTSAVV